MLIEIHILQNHAPSNLNRDDTGSPKECVFGGVKRARISSQCLKRSIRQSDIFQRELAGQLGMRTRRLPELVRERLEKDGLPSDLAAVAALKSTGFGTKDGKERPKGDDNKDLDTAQTMFLTEPDIEAVVAVLKKAAEEAGNVKKFEAVKASDLQALAKTNGFRPISVDVALFGRMITSEAFRDVEASIQVAHALSTHKVDHEFDYFTAVDDLQVKGEDDAGADMIGDFEFNSSCYYKYVSLDVHAFCRNLTGEGHGRRVVNDEDKAKSVELAKKTVDAFLRGAIMSTPSGKQNSCAAHQLPSLILIEVRPYRTPVSYANAFVEPAYAGKGTGLVVASLEKIGAHIQALTDGFDLEASTRLLLAPEHPEFAIHGVERVPSLNTLCARLQEVVVYG